MSRFGNKVNILLASIRSGKDEALDKLFEKTYNHLKTVAALYLFNPLDAEDVVSEAFLRACRYIHTFKDGMDGYNWLCKIVQNVAYDFNAKRIPSEGSNVLELLPAVERFESSPELYLENKELLKALNALAQRDRTVVLLYVFGGYSFTEITNLLNIPKTTVYDAYKRSERAIIKFMDKE